MRYMPVLDGLRAVAIALVLLFHAKVPGLPGGNLGVDVFFMLSGFLITRLLLAEQISSGGIDIKRFYWRRILRLMPPLLVLLVLYAVFAPLVWPDYYFHLRDGVMTFFYLGNLGVSTGYTPTYLLHGWSLGVEEQFYLVWPLFLLAISRLRLPLWQLLSVLYLLGSVWRYLFLLVLDGAPGVAYYRPDIHGTGLLLGGVIGAWVHEHTRLRGCLSSMLPGVCLFGLLVAVLWPRSEVMHLLVFVPLAELCVAGILLWLVSHPLEASRHWLARKPVVAIGKLSYGLYLFHYPLMKALEPVGWQITMAFGTAGAFALAAISYRVVEMPVRKYRLSRYG